MRLRGFLGIVSGLALGACVVMTNDGDRGDQPGGGGKAGVSGSSGRAGSGGSAGSAGKADSGPDSASGGTGDAALDSAPDDADTDSAADGATEDSGGNGGTSGSGGSATDGGPADGGGQTVGVQCRAIVDACPLVALAECQFYLAGLTASARARVVSCMSSGCNLTTCLRDL
jgi:hypothetical protein